MARQAGIAAGDIQQQRACAWGASVALRQVAQPALELQAPLAPPSSGVSCRAQWWGRGEQSWLCLPTGRCSAAAAALRTAAAPLQRCQGLPAPAGQPALQAAVWGVLAGAGCQPAWVRQVLLAATCAAPPALSLWQGRWQAAAGLGQALAAALRGRCAALSPAPAAGRARSVTCTPRWQPGACRASADASLLLHACCQLASQHMLQASRQQHARAKRQHTCPAGEAALHLPQPAGDQRHLEQPCGLAGARPRPRSGPELGLPAQVMWRSASHLLACAGPAHASSRKPLGGLQGCGRSSVRPAGR